MQATIQSIPHHSQKETKSCEANSLHALEKRRDPLQVLPPELISAIFEFAPTSVLTCTTVSHAWQDYLFGLASPWKKACVSVENMGIDESSTLALNTRGLLAIKTFRSARLKYALAKYMHSLTIHARQDPVRELLNITNYQDVFLPDPSKRLHLTHLHINTGMDSTNALRVILYICPNLVKLAYEKRYAPVQATAWMYSFVRDPPTTQLQSLDWCECIEFVSSSALIIRHCPQLTSFATNAHCSFHFDIINVTGLCHALLKHCPALHTIDFNTVSQHDLVLSFRAPVSTLHKPGSLSVLRLGLGHVMDRQLLEALMEQSQETLEKVSLSESEDIAGVVRKELPIPFSRLHYVSIASTSVPKECLASFFLQCTNLTSLKLSISITDELTTTIAELPALEQLTIDGECTPASTLGDLFHRLALHCRLK
ncbi:hypothetical protein BCR43DRAFT_564725, partial [Syncephalastrum racemosum]